MRFFFLVCCLAGPLAAQSFETNVSNRGTVAASFLEIGVGARAEALGGAVVAETGRPEQLYWNPAGLAYLDGLAFTATHTEWLAETQFQYAALATPLPRLRSVLGVSVTTLGIPAQPVRTVENPEGTGERYDARDLAVTVGLAARLIESFAVGVSAKYIDQRIWSESARQVAFDVGVYYQTPVPGLALGSSLSHFGEEMALSGKNLTTIIDPDPFNTGVENIPVVYRTDAFPLPQVFRFGLRYARAVPGQGRVVTSLALLHPTGATESMQVGAEYAFHDVLFVRAGYQGLFERAAESGLTLGGGLAVRLPARQRLAFDYAWSDWGFLDQAHRFSLSLFL